jgi:hypothetical protein
MKIYPIEAGNFKLDGGAMFGVVPKTIWNKTNPADENNLIDSLITNPSVYWSGPTVPDTTLNLINYLKESGYGVFEPVKVGLLPNGNRMWNFAKSGVSSES